MYTVYSLFVSDRNSSYPTLSLDAFHSVTPQPDGVYKQLRSSATVNHLLVQCCVSWGASQLMHVI